MASARDALNARVRELIERRLGREQTTAREECAEYVRQLYARGFTARQIGDRVGASRSTIHQWGRAARAPVDYAQFQKLAMMMRNALALPVIARPTYTGMRLVLDTLRAARRCSWRQLERDLRGKLNATGGLSVTRWMSGEGQPCRRATIAIRDLARQSGLPLALIETCDSHLLAIAERDQRAFPWALPDADPRKVAFRAQLAATHARRHARADERRALVIQLKASGLTSREIAARIGVTRVTVNRYLRRAA